MVRLSLNCNLRIRKLQVQCGVLSLTSRLDKPLPMPVSRGIGVWCKKVSFLTYMSFYRQSACVNQPISGLPVSLKIFRTCYTWVHPGPSLISWRNALLLNSYSAKWYLFLLQPVNLKRKSNEDSGSWVNCLSYIKEYYFHMLPFLTSAFGIG